MAVSVWSNILYAVVVLCSVTLCVSGMCKAGRPRLVVLENNK